MGDAIPKTGTIKQNVFIEATPEQVYDAYTNVKKHAEFTNSKATGVAKVGKKMTAWDGYIIAKYTRLVKGKLIEQEWWTTEWPDGYKPSTFRLTLTKKGKGTQVKMVQTNVPLSQIEDYRQGWTDYYWKPLKDYFR